MMMMMSHAEPVIGNIHRFNGRSAVSTSHDGDHLAYTYSQPNLYVRAKKSTASQDQLQVSPSVHHVVPVGEDSLGEPPIDSYGLAIAYPKQQQQQQQLNYLL